MNAANCGRRVGAKVKVGLARFQSLHQPSLTQGHRLNLHRPGQRCKHHFADLGNLSRSISPNRSGLQMGGGRLAANIMDYHFVATLQKIVRHVGTHRAQSYKSHLGHHVLQFSNSLYLIAKAPPLSGRLERVAIGEYPAPCQGLRLIAYLFLVTTRHGTLPVR